MNVANPLIAPLVGFGPTSSIHRRYIGRPEPSTSADPIHRPTGYRPVDRWIACRRACHTLPMYLAGVAVQTGRRARRAGSGKCACAGMKHYTRPFWHVVCNVPVGPGAFGTPRAFPAASDSFGNTTRP